MRAVNEGTSPVDLIRAEFDVRAANGAPADVGEYAQRFPNQFEAFYKSVLQSKMASEATWP